MQPDSLIPDPSNPQAWNRYSYVGNNPIRFNDPSGHIGCDETDGKGNCVDLKTAIKNDIESKYNIKVKGKWNEDELGNLSDALKKFSSAIGGADNFNQMVRDALGKGNSLTMYRNAYYVAHSYNNDFGILSDDPSAPDRCHACFDTDTITLSNNIFNPSYQTRQRKKLGITDINIGIQMTMIHEMVHMMAKAHPLAKWKYALSVDNRKFFGSGWEENMASAIALYSVGGGPKGSNPVITDVLNGAQATIDWAFE